MPGYGQNRILKRTTTPVRRKPTPRCTGRMPPQTYTRAPSKHAPEMEQQAPKRDKSSRPGIQSVEIAYRLLKVLQTSASSLALKDIAQAAELTPSAANNYFVSLVRTGLAAQGERAGFYKLGPAAMALGMSAIQQIDGFDLMRREVTRVRDETLRSAAVTTWTDDGVLSLFKQDGEHRGAFEMRTGLIPLTSTAAGKTFAAWLPLFVTRPFLVAELDADAPGTADGPAAFREEAVSELESRKYSTMHRAGLSEYASIAAPVFDFAGQLRFAISLVGSRSTLQTEPGSAHVMALLASAARATADLGGKP